MGYFPVRFNSRVVIYNRKMFIRLATDQLLCVSYWITIIISPDLISGLGSCWWRIIWLIFCCKKKFCSILYKISFPSKYAWLLEDPLKRVYFEMKCLRKSLKWWKVNLGMRPLETSTSRYCNVWVPAFRFTFQAVQPDG